MVNIKIIDTGANRYLIENDTIYLGRRYDDGAELITVEKPDVEKDSVCLLFVATLDGKIIDQFTVGNEPIAVTSNLSQYPSVKLGFSFLRADDSVKNSEPKQFFFLSAIKPVGFTPTPAQKEPLYQLLTKAFAKVTVDGKDLSFYNIFDTKVATVEVQGGGGGVNQQQSDLAEIDTTKVTFIKGKKTSNLQNDGDGESPFATEKDLSESITPFTQSIQNVDTKIDQHVKRTDNPHGVTKSQVGLGNVDNTADKDKPISNAMQSALNGKQSSLSAAQLAAANSGITGAKVSDYDNHLLNKENPHAVTKAQVGLGSVDNTADIEKPVSTKQQAELNKKLNTSGGTVTGNLVVQGDLTVSGTTKTEHAEDLAVDAPVIIVNGKKVDLATLLAGLAINKNSTETYGLVYDPATNSVKFGLGTLDDDNHFTFNLGEGLPLAIRDDSDDFTDGHIVEWNAQKNKLKDGGKKIADLLEKSTGSRQVYGTDVLGNQQMYGVAAAPSLAALQRLIAYSAVGLGTADPKVSIAVTVPTADYDAAPKKYVDDNTGIYIDTSLLAEA